MIYFLLGFIVFIYIIRKSNTADLIKQANIETDEQEDIFDDAVLNIKSTKLSCIFLATSLISLIVIVLIRYTTIELFFMNYFGSEWFREDITISLAYYGIPFFILIIRGIIVQVNIGDYVKKNFNLHEEEVNIKDEAKKLLFKPKKKTATPEAPASGETLELTTGFVSATTAPTPVDTTPAPAPQPVAAVQPVAPVAPVAEQTTPQQ
jgi:hypothetical protein